MAEREAEERERVRMGEQEGARSRTRKREKLPVRTGLMLWQVVSARHCCRAIKTGTRAILPT
jgi:hypothetical protein